MKRNIIALSAFLFAAVSFGQDAVVAEIDKSVANAKTKEVAVKDSSNWDLSGAFNVNLTQVGLKNWAGGGQSSISLGTLLKLNANYQKGKHSWFNSFDGSYGVAQVGGSKKLFKKTDDQIIVVSKYGYELSKNWSASGLLDFRTQFAPGYQYTADTSVAAGERKTNIISEAFAPAYALIAAGLEYRKTDVFYALIAPIAGKVTIVGNQTLADAGAFGVEKGDNIRFELGSVLKAGVNFKQLAKNVSFSSNLTLFQSYESIGHIDVNWETLTVFKINKYLSTTFSTLLIYDDDILIADEEGKNATARVQFKDVLAIGFLAKF